MIFTKNESKTLKVIFHHLTCIYPRRHFFGKTCNAASKTVVPCFLKFLFIIILYCLHRGGAARNRNIAEQGPGHMTLEWLNVIGSFLKTAKPSSFSSNVIKKHFYQNVNNARNVCILVTLSSTDVKLSPEHFLSAGNSRLNSTRYILNKILSDVLWAKQFQRRPVTFLVMLNDGHRPLVPTFGSARHWVGWDSLIPVPMGNDRGIREGWGTPLRHWDTYINETVSKTHRNYIWERKIGKAIFRGALGMQRYKLGSCNKENNGRCSNASDWSETNRGVLFLETENDDLFDVGFTSYRKKSFAGISQFNRAPSTVEGMDMVDFQRYKFVLNVGSNQDWAERLRTLLFMNSAVVLHEAETKEFFTPLLKPWVHYIPTNVMLSDLTKHVHWALHHDKEVQDIVRQANLFAKRYISENAMCIYWKIAIEEFARLQKQADNYF